MSGKDRTEERLLESIRKTRAEAGAETEAPGKQDSQRRRAPTAGRKTGRTRSTERARKRPAAAPPDATTDPYRGGRRVWPDCSALE